VPRGATSAEFGARVRFGPVLPQTQAARQLVQWALQGRLGDVLPDAALAGLRDRAQALG
jgi:hypothetical protein